MRGRDRVHGPSRQTTSTTRRDRMEDQHGSSSSSSSRPPTVRLGRVQPQPPTHRTIFVNDRDSNLPVRFKGNSVSTTKFNVLTFLPKGLYEQFRRVANLYFLMISILSTTPISPVSPITNVVPLSLVLLVSLVKEAFEDWRLQNDREINGRKADILQDDKWESTPWRKLQVGDIVRVKQDGYFPADLLFIASSNPDGVCYIETANLDGETNLKIRKALEKTWDYLTPNKASEFKGVCETGRVATTGCSLRNTEYIVGVVIFTGHETKVMMNTMNVPSKRSTLERKLDKLILMLFGTLFLMCLIGAIGSGFFINRKHFYLGLQEGVEKQFNPDSKFVVAVLTMFTLITLYSTIIPISLYVSIEMIKFIQSNQFINNDLHMYHVETNTPALARTSNLNEELGQVEYIFSDKTGTLTRNLMEFFKCSIGGVVYGTGVTEIERGSAQRNGMKLDEVKRSATSVHEKFFNFDDARLMRGAWRNECDPDICKIVEDFQLLITNGLFMITWISKDQGRQERGNPNQKEGTALVSFKFIGLNVVPVGAFWMIPPLGSAMAGPSIGAWGGSRRRKGYMLLDRAIWGYDVRLKIQIQALGKLAGMTLWWVLGDRLGVGMCNGGDLEVVFDGWRVGVCSRKGVEERKEVILRKKAIHTSEEFFRCLAVCHTVLPEGDESPEKITYQAASPDEAALVTAAKNFGFFFYRRTPTSILVRESHVEKIGNINDVTYEILNVLEFNSTRKRQSVICRYPDGRLILYCKGADTVIYERLAVGNDDIKNLTREHLEQFGSAGLRTLCLAYKNLDTDFYESWNEKFIQAKSSLRDREKKLDEVADLIEEDLVLIGCTAIEDKLQEGVPLCIETLSRGGIKIWVLTGDKMETAINIGYACNLINNEMKQFIINSDTDAVREVESKGDPVEAAGFIREMVKEELEKCLGEAQTYLHATVRIKLALVIDGKCLMYALDPALRGTLLDLSLNCSSVICCRVSPLQKAQVTSMVKKDAGKITLSIGDGANDVSMIQAAHVGVGISGLEGMQAVMASDFAIAQFRFLTDLLLVHGRWSYLRICKVVMYFFYKNLTFTLTQFWFTFYTGFSGQRFYDDWFQSLYNVIFTALPVIILGLFDKDVNASLSKNYPELYKEGIKDSFFRWRVVGIWAFFAVYQSLVFFSFVTSSSRGAHNFSGKIFGHWDVSTMAFNCVVVAVNLRIVTPYDRQENVYFVIYVLMSTIYFYFTLLLVPIVALLGDFIYQGVQRWFFPYDYQIIQEIHKDEPEVSSKTQFVEIGPRMTADEERSYAISQLPRETSRHTGFAFDSPGYESFFASQQGVYAPQKAWDVARRASMKSKTKSHKKK
ncbi:hypothetical protein Syun_020802 [Stephania yunnanensis]|uniref:Phospholipid-transporting ATPase n=1 Tax=Stephania yunnanensis TaxID=152371 RepID=A0AAP0IEW0_9MAGN